MSCCGAASLLGFHLMKVLVNGASSSTGAKAVSHQDQRVLEVMVTWGEGVCGRSKAIH